MTRERVPTKADLKAHLDYWRTRLCPEWAVAFSWERPTIHPECRMESSRASDYLAATIRVKPLSEWHVDPEEGGIDLAAEVTVVHELLHNVMHDVGHAHVGVEEHMHREAWRVQERVFRHCLERVVDRLAVALVYERSGAN